MPVETWDEATYNQFYRFWDNAAQQYVGYTRTVLIDQNKNQGFKTPFEIRQEALVANHNIQQGERLLVVGAGFGGLVEAFHDAGFLNCWGVDNSPYIEANQGTEVRNDVVLISDDIRAGGRILNALRQATGDDQFDWVFTEDVVSCYDDADVLDLLPLLDGTLLFSGLPSSNVVNMTTHASNGRRMDSALNAKSLQEWQTFYSAHSWMGMNGEVP